MAAQALSTHCLRAILLNMVLVSSLTTAVAEVDHSKMKLVLDETFDRPLDLRRWHVGTDGRGRQWGSDSYFVTEKDPQFGETYVVSDGVLRIRATYDPSFSDPNRWGRHWYSGEISTVFPRASGKDVAMRRGYIEARMKLPAGAGIWCALWGQNLAYFKGDKTKGHVEIDGFEHYGALPHKISTTVHDWSDPAFPGRKPGKSLAENNSLPDLSEDFHVYGVLVGKDTVVTYIDGVRANVAAIAQEGIDKFAWTIDLAIGGGWPVAASPTHNYELDISSVKIWSADSD